MSTETKTRKSRKSIVSNGYTTLNGYLSWINRYPLIGVLGGVVFGPLAYLAGQKLGAIQGISGLSAWLYLGLSWGLAILLLLTMNRQWGAKLNKK